MSRTREGQGRGAKKPEVHFWTGRASVSAELQVDAKGNHGRQRLMEKPAVWPA